jgi:hypothetical protein
MLQLFPLASPQHDLGLVLVRAEFEEAFAAQHPKPMKHDVPVAVGLARPKYFLS